MSDAERMRKARADKARAEGREPGRPGRPVSQPCGTPAAFRRHQRVGETPCEACRQAERDRQAALARARRAERRQG